MDTAFKYAEGPRPASASIDPVPPTAKEEALPESDQGPPRSAEPQPSASVRLKVSRAVFGGVGVTISEAVAVASRSSVTVSVTV